MIFLARASAGKVPIGSIIPWTKSFTGVATLANQGRTEFVEYNGQVLSDASSPLNGQTLPNLNSGQNRFLRGNSTSGTTSGAATHTHTLSFSISSAAASSDIAPITNLNSPTGNNNVLPVPAYDVVWIGRIK